MTYKEKKSLYESIMKEVAKTNGKRLPANVYNSVAVWKPKDSEELKNVIEGAIKIYGDQVNLNWIDVSNVTNMKFMFYDTTFNGDISQWNVSNVTNMEAMFCSSEFNQDLSKWDVSNVTNMNFMFAYSQFNGDISKWDVSNVTDMGGMFIKSPLEKNLPKWYKK